MIDQDGLKIVKKSRTDKRLKIQLCGTKDCEDCRFYSPAIIGGHPIQGMCKYLHIVQKWEGNKVCTYEHDNW